MKKAIVWGTGKRALSFSEYKVMYNEYEIVCFTDSDSKKWGTKFLNYSVLSPQEALEYDFDYVLIWSDYYEEISDTLLSKFHVNRGKTKTFLELIDDVRERVIKKYNGSKDLDIKKVVDYFAEQGFNVYGDYVSENTLDEVFYDSEGFPYINFKGKRMYYPRSEHFYKLDGREYVKNIIYEQGEGSPHKYVTSRNERGLHGVIVDAGVREGNFALSYIDIASKIYLIEADEEWLEALRRTFAPYKEKVVFCGKYLSNSDTDTTITLDTLIGNEPVDFIKMDIEGAELSALEGAVNILNNSNAQCAICAYHRRADIDGIEKILKECNYNTSTSSGYMLFPYCDEKPEDLELRRGIVYGEK